MERIENFKFHNWIFIGNWYRPKRGHELRRQQNCIELFYWKINYKLILLIYGQIANLFEPKAKTKIMKKQHEERAKWKIIRYEMKMDKNQWIRDHLNSSVPRNGSIGRILSFFLYFGEYVVLMLSQTFICSIVK